MLFQFCIRNEEFNDFSILTENSNKTVLSVQVLARRHGLIAYRWWVSFIIEHFKCQFLRQAFYLFWMRCCCLIELFNCSFVGQLFLYYIVTNKTMWMVHVENCQWNVFIRFEFLQQKKKKKIGKLKMNKKKIRIGMIVRFTFLIQSTQRTYRFLFYFIDVKPLNACYHIEYQLKYRMHA